MEYDKDSFLAGIAVGRRIKGWSGGSGSGGGGGGSIGNGLIFSPFLTIGLQGKLLDVPVIIYGTFVEEDV